MSTLVEMELEKDILQEESENDILDDIELEGIDHLFESNNTLFNEEEEGDIL